MKIENILSKLYALGIKISVVNNNLKIQSTREKIPVDLLEDVKANKNALIDYLNGGGEKNIYIEINNIETKDYYRLSSAQKRLYLLQQMDLGTTAYNIPYTISLGDKIDKEKIEKVFRQLISRHESFRTSFEILGEEPVQRICEDVNFKIDVFTIKKTGEQSIKDNFIQAFNLSQAPLLRVAIIEIEGEGKQLMIDMHHIISDGFSHTILEREFETLYSGKELTPLKLQYKDYSEWQASEGQQHKVKGQEIYWLRKFEGEIPVLNLPVDYTRPVMQSYEGTTVRFALSTAETQKIKLLAKENGLTLYMSVLSVFNILLSKLSGQEDIIVGTPVANRNHSDLENIVGMFVNTLALRNEVNGNDTIKEFIGKLKQTTIGAFENQDYQFEDLVEKISVERDTSRNPVFDVMFDLLARTDNTGDLLSFVDQKLVHTKGISKFDLTLSTIDFGEQILLSIEYSTKLFGRDTIERLISYFKRVTYQLVDRLNDRISTLEIVTESEKQKLLYEFNNTKVDFPRDKTICQLFDEQANRTPNLIAIVKDDINLSYSELNRKVNQFAKGILTKGFALGSKIGILVDRSVESIISILGVLRSGCIYLPIDKDSPKERLNYIIKDSNMDAILGTVFTVSDGIELSLPVLNYEETLNVKAFDSFWEAINNKDLAYILYTSGTTGSPKGVIVGHQNLINLVSFQISNYQLGTTDRVLQFSALTFDASMEQIGISLLSGGQLVLIEKEKLLNIDDFYKYIANNNITHLDVVPTFLTGLTPEKCKGLKRLVVGGEYCEKALAEKWSRKLSFYNAYGPTETTITSTELKVDNYGLDKLSIGKPLANTQIYILDKFAKTQPIGVPGELCISGEGVALGYLNNPELTIEKFISHPFNEGERLYRTGDLARWLPDGNIEFLGRMDNQVKIRGFRIELGEIETVLLRHESVKASVVLAREENGEKHLCAYVVLKNELGIEALRSYLSGLLPDYMVPSYFVELDELPITSNGKINRKALPFPEIKVGDDYLGPSNDTEEKLVGIWSEVLNISREEISVKANFFAIGGHSLRASSCINMLRNIFNVNIPLIEIFKNPTIIQLANFINANKLKIGMDDDHLALLKEGDANGGNIFLIHDGTGEVDSYIEFCKQTTDKINYWGIRAGKLKKYEPINIAIEQLAKTYLKCIRKVQPNGEYNIAGWSIGGVIAFEMVRQLEQEKQKLRFFGIIDSMAPNITVNVKIEEFTTESELSWIKKYINDDEVIAGLNVKEGLKGFWHDLILYLKSLDGADKIIREDMVKNIGLNVKEYGKVSIEELIKYMNFTRSMKASCDYYTPTNIINSQINFFAASNSKNILVEKWCKFSSKDLYVKKVKGDHYSIFKQPNVRRFYKQFKECFNNVNKEVLFETEQYL